MLEFKLIMRNLFSNGYFLIMNILSISIAFSFVLILIFYVKSESEVDEFHENKDVIYQLVHDNECSFSSAFGQYVMETISGIKDFTRVFNMSATLKCNSNVITSEKCLFVDSTFFSIFSYPLIEGQKNEVLNTKSNVVITESFAKSIFGNENPIGNDVLINNRVSYLITGIVKDFDEKTHFSNPDIILPFTSLTNFFGDYYLTQLDFKFASPGIYFLSESPNVDMEEKSDMLMEKVKSWYWVFQDGGSTSLSFKPLTDVYFNPANYNFAGGIRSGNYSQILLLFFVVIFIIIVASVNYISQSLSKSLKKADTISVKMVYGANSYNIFISSILETLFFFCLCLLLSLVLIALILPAFNQLSGYQIHVKDIFSSTFLLLATTVLISIVIISGTLPAYILSGAKPLSILQKNLQVFNVKKIQQGLLMFQFAISVVLICFSLSILNQNNYINNFDLGFESEKVLYIKLNREIQSNKKSFKSELMKIPGVNSVALCNSMPGVGILTLDFKFKDKLRSYDLFHIDEDYFETMGIKCNNSTIQNACWITQSVAEELELDISDNNIELELSDTQKLNLEIIDRISNVYNQSLFNKSSPAIYIKLDEQGWTDYALVNFTTDNFKNFERSLKDTYSRFSLNFPFDYSILKDRLDLSYVDNKRIFNVIINFTIFTLIILCFGIFTLTLFTCQNNLKEIGIRKVFGSSSIQVLWRIIKTYTIMIIISTIIAFPFTFIIVDKWFNQFYYKSSISWWSYGVSFAVLFILVFISIICHYSWVSKQNITNIINKK